MNKDDPHFSTASGTYDVPPDEPQIWRDIVGLRSIVKQTPNIASLAEALSKAQADFGQIDKRRTATIQMKSGGQFSYKYADLSDVLKGIRAPLAANGLSILQPIIQNEDHLLLVTRLLHSSGEWIESTYPLNTYATPQEMGSAISYARRYALTALLGIAADEDDDAQAAQPARPVTRQKAATSPQAAQEPSAPKPESQPPKLSQTPTEQTERIRVIALIRKVAEQRKVVDKINWADLAALDLAELKALYNEVGEMSA